MCDKDYLIDPEYDVYIQGRANIFGLFILHSLSLIKLGGIMAFIVPKSFLNSIYYSKIRNHIKKTCEIIEIIVCHFNFNIKQKLIFFMIFMSLNHFRDALE